MKKTTLSLLSAIIMFCSACYRDYSPPTQNVIQYNQARLGTGDLTQGVVTVAVYQNQETPLVFYFTPIDANFRNKTASCELMNIPPGLVVSPTSATVGIPGEWAPHLGAIADTGMYDMSVNVQRDDDSKTYPFRVHVIPPPPPPNCTKCMSGQWSSKNNCHEGEDCTVTIDTIPGIPDSVDIRNIDCLGDSIVVRAYLSCDGIIIPRQTTHGYTIYGSKTDAGGLCNYIFMSIRDTVEHNGNTDYCILHLTR